ncbi:MAG: hemolysin family protein [Acidobacteriota bacterium]
MEVEIALLIVLIFLSGFFSGSEIAFFSLSEVDLRILVEKRVHGARHLSKMLKNPSRLLATILIGNNLVNIGAAGLATVITEYYFHSYSVGIAVGVMTLLILIFGEVTPKGICTSHARTIAPILARPMSFFNFLFWPISIILEKFLKRIIPKERRLFLGSDDEIAEKEVTTRAQMGVEEGTIDQEEFEFIQNVFEFHDTTVEEIMTPKSDMISLPAESKISDHIDFFMNVSQSRIPLYIENSENIVGILYIKDMLHLALRKETGKTLKDVMLQPLFVPEQMKAAELFRIFQKRSIHMAIVVDEFGQTVGLITMEDLLEELVGEIEDESDVAIKPITKVSDTEFLVEGSTSIEIVNKVLGLNLPEEEHRTISGLILEKIQYIPKPGEEFNILGMDIIIKKASRKKIIELLVKIKK